MENYAHEMLTSEGLAIHMPLDIWIDIAEDVHLREEFVINIVESLDSTEEYEWLDLALRLSNHSGNNISVFWTCIYKLDGDRLYPKAIFAATKTYDFELIKEELIERLIVNGDQILTQIQDGVFKSIILNEDEDYEGDPDHFFIYTIYPLYWKENSK